MNILFFTVLLVISPISGTHDIAIDNGPFVGTSAQLIKELHASEFDLSHNEIKEILLMRFAQLSPGQKRVLLPSLHHVPAGYTSYDVLKDNLGGSIYLCDINGQKHFVDNQFCKQRSHHLLPKRIRTLFKRN